MHRIVNCSLTLPSKQPSSLSKALFPKLFIQVCCLQNPLATSSLSSPVHRLCRRSNRAASQAPCRRSGPLPRIVHSSLPSRNNPANLKPRAPNCSLSLLSQRPSSPSSPLSRIVLSSSPSQRPSSLRSPAASQVPGAGPSSGPSGLPTSGQTSALAPFPVIFQAERPVDHRFSEHFAKLLSRRGSHFRAYRLSDVWTNCHPKRLSKYRTKLRSYHITFHLIGTKLCSERRERRSYIHSHCRAGPSSVPSGLPTSGQTSAPQTKRTDDVV